MKKEIWEYMSGDLFARESLHDWLNARTQSIVNEIRNLDSKYVLSVDETAYLAYISEKYLIEPPSLHTEKQYLKTREVSVKNNYPSPWNEGTWYTDKIAYTLHIPFTGDSACLQYKPSTFTLSGWSLFSVGSGYIYGDIFGKSSVEETKSEIARAAGAASDMFEYAQSDIQLFNDEVASTASSAFAARKERALKERKEIEDLGIPIVQDNKEALTYTVPTVAKKRSFAMKPPVAKSTSPTPRLEDQAYREILSSLKAFGQSLEESPDSYTSMGEEDLRNLFLAHLKDSFSSLSATGETFNNHGKTDIMVKSGNMILFIAECKIWKGASQIQSSIDQLLGYLTWRQSKAALILFVRSKNIDNVLVEIPKQVKAHSYYVRENSIQSKGQLQYILHLESGKDNEIDLSVLVFHLPKT